MITNVLETTLKPTQDNFYKTSQSQKRAMESAAALASNGMFDDYLIYEQNGECWFGGGAVRSITVFADRIESRQGDRLLVRKVSSEQLCEALTEELANWEGKWQACGWACFEFAYALKTPELLNDEERAGHVPLLYLCEPLVAVSLGDGPIRIESKTASLSRQVQEVLDCVPHLPPRQPEPVVITDSPAYEQSVARALDQIHGGALEKVILSRRLKLNFKPDFVATWLLGREQNTPSRSFTLNLKGWQVSGFSPEIVMSVDKNRLVTTEPLAGTRRLDGLLEDDLSRFNELYSDPKETHEHAISVRLSVDEIRETCEPETIGVRQFMERKQRGSVQHLASTVCGKLREDCTPWQAFASLFPAVTASGIPKREAFSEIRRHESDSRGLYAGAILRIDHDGVFDAALVLRSLLGHQQEAWLQAGAGVVSGSHPARELTETSEKLGSIAPWVVKAV